MYYFTKTSHSSRSKLFYFSFPRGLKIINNDGNKVNEAKSAVNIAKPVKSPKYIVGIKFDKDKIEKPITIIEEV